MERPTFKSKNEEIAFTAGMIAKSFPIETARTGAKMTILRNPKLKAAYEKGKAYREALFPNR